MRLQFVEYENSGLQTFLGLACATFIYRKILVLLQIDFKRGVIMAGLELAEVILAVIIGTLAAIVYSLRVLILLERRVASMEENIQKMTAKVLKEETIIEKALKRKK